MKQIKRIWLLILLLSFSAFAQITTQQWVNMGRMLVPVSYAQAVVKDSLIYVIGGYSDSSRNFINLIQEYNPRVNKWRIAGTLLARRGSFYAGVYKDSIFAVGGYTGGGGATGGPLLRNGIEFWKPSTGNSMVWKVNEWFNRYYFSGATIDNRVFLFGGSGRLEKVPNDHYVIEINLLTGAVSYSNDSLFQFGPFPSSQMSVVVNGTVYLFGGFVEGLIASVYAFNPDSRKMKKLAFRMAEPRIEGAVVYAGQNEVILIGGQSESSLGQNSTTIYTVNGDSIVPRIGPPLLTGRQAFAAVRYKSSVYIFGGRDRFQHTVSNVERLDIGTSVDKDPELIPGGFVLHDNYPNPFNPSTNIKIDLASYGTVRIVIFDILGRTIKEITRGEYAPGSYTFTWSADDASGATVPSGVYLCRMYVNNKAFTKKMLYIR